METSQQENKGKILELITQLEAEVEAVFEYVTKHGDSQIQLETRPIFTEEIKDIQLTSRAIEEEISLS